MAKDKGDFADIATSIIAEIKNDAPKIAASLFPAALPGMSNMTKTAYLDLVRRNWGDLQFRQGMLTRVGADNFKATIKEAFGVQAWPDTPAPTVPPPPIPQPSPPPLGIPGGSFVPAGAVLPLPPPGGNVSPVPIMDAPPAQIHGGGPLI